MPNIAAVIINYLRTDDTLRALESLEPIVSSDILSVIVIDSASTEQSRQALSSFTGYPINLRFFDENTGFAGGANLGIAAAFELGADAVWLLNSDARVAPNALLEMLRTMMEWELPIVGSTIYYDDGSNRLWFYRGKVYRPSFIVEHVGKGRTKPLEELAAEPLETDFVSGCSMLIRMDVFETVGLFDESLFLYCEDVDFCLRAHAEGYQTAIAPRSVVYHGVSQASGGEFNLLKEYYNTRNSFVLIKRNTRDWFKRAAAYLLRALWDIWRIAGALRRSGRSQTAAFSLFWAAYCDFRANRLGQRAPDSLPAGK